MLKFLKNNEKFIVKTIAFLKIFVYIWNILNRGG